MLVKTHPHPPTSSPTLSPNPKNPTNSATSPARPASPLPSPFTVTGSTSTTFKTAASIDRDTSRCPPFTCLSV
ncbi:hypothetical protein P692DRAFT_20835160 [Suillus brevipes Sb2]|nr:hypothetical protein P692DRAFT_20835160 [Suillus brevipes Sb2]